MLSPYALNVMKVSAVVLLALGVAGTIRVGVMSPEYLGIPPLVALIFGGLATGLVLLQSLKRK